MKTLLSIIFIIALVNTISCKQKQIDPFCGKKFLKYTNDGGWNYSIIEVDSAVIDNNQAYYWKNGKENELIAQKIYYFYDQCN